MRRSALPLSLLTHALLLIIIFLWPPEKLVAPSPVRAIEIEMISVAQLEVETASPVAILSAPPVEALPDAVEVPVAQPQMQTATTFLSGDILKDPANRAVRDTLPKLAQEERITQLCNIEALEQIRLVQPGPLPDSLSASAFAETVLEGLTLDVPGGAFRAGGLWYGVRFTCTAASDFEAVTAFAFQLGDPIPRAEWESHDLIAEDQDE